MPSVNNPNPRTDQTVKVFDAFYNYEAAIPQLEYDAVYSFFASVFTTKQAAGNFSVALFRISEQTSTPVMTLLQQMQGLDQTELTLTMAYYLNSNRSPATLLGINAPVTPNYYVARNIIA